MQYYTKTPEEHKAWREKELDEIASKQNVQDIKDPHIRRVTGLLMENQQLIDAAQKSDSYSVVPNAKEIVKKAYSTLFAHKIISVQPMLGPCSVLYYKEFKKTKGSPKELLTTDEFGIVVESEESVAKTRRLKFAPEEPIDTDKAAIALRNEIDSEILTDLWNNPRTTGRLSKNATSEEMVNCMRGISNCIHRKTMKNTLTDIVIGRKK